MYYLVTNGVNVAYGLFILAVEQRPDNILVI